MAIWDRLENVIKSYLNDDHGGTPKSGSRKYNDPDLNAAFEELDDYLGENEKRKNSKSSAWDEFTDDSNPRKTTGNRNDREKREVPKELYRDFEALGLTPEATAEECKSAYKKLLKIHHPDRHAGHPENMKKATEKSAKINDAYSRIERWFHFSG